MSPNDNKFSKDKPLYTTGVVASILGITTDRLRTYDSEKLITTHRMPTGKVDRRLYTQYDVEWLLLIRKLVKEYKMSISSLKFLLQVIYNNPKVKLPKNEIGKTLLEMSENPNFKPIVREFGR